MNDPSLHAEGVSKPANERGRTRRTGPDAHD